MHSGQRLCSGHLSNEACKVLTSSFGHVFSPFPRLSLGAIAFPFPFTTLARRVEGWGFGGGGRRGLGRDLGLSQGRCGAGLQPSQYVSLAPCPLWSRVPFLSAREGRPGRILGPRSRPSFQRRIESAPALLRSPRPGRLPSQPHAGALLLPGAPRSDLPQAPSGPHSGLLGLHPPLPPQQRRRKSVCVSVGCAGCGGGEGY